MRAIPPAQSGNQTVIPADPAVSGRCRHGPSHRRRTAPYVGAWEADTQAAGITREDMDLIRSKKTLYLSKSFGMYTVRAVSGILGKNEGDLLYLKILENGKFNYTGVGENKRPVLTGTENAWADYSLQHFIYEFEPLWQRLLDLEYAVDYYNERLAPDHLDAVIVNWGQRTGSLQGTGRTRGSLPPPADVPVRSLQSDHGTFGATSIRTPGSFMSPWGCIRIIRTRRIRKRKTRGASLPARFPITSSAISKAFAPLLDLRDLLSTPLGQPGQPKCGTEGAGPGCYMCDAFHMPGSEHFDL